MSSIVSALLAPKLLVICAVSVIAPIISDQVKRIFIPSIVLEILLGIIIGPQVLDILQPTQQIKVLADVGLSFLMFLAGYEINLKRIYGKPINSACASWVLSFVIAVGLMLVLRSVMNMSGGGTLNPILVGLALTSTSFGILLPILMDAKVFKSSFGDFVLGVSTIGEFGPIVAVTLLFTQAKSSSTFLFLILFLFIAVMASYFAIRTHQPRFILFLRRHLNTSNQLPVRISVFLIFLLVYLTIEFGLNILLGAFTAGIVVRLLTMGKDEKTVDSKLKAIGFGLLIPIFFIASGITFDLHALASWRTSIKIPIFLGCILLVHAIPKMFFYKKLLDRPHQQALIFFSATGLPLIIVIAHIGVTAGSILPRDASALVAAGMLSVLLFPMLGLYKLKNHPSELDLLEPEKITHK